MKRAYDFWEWRTSFALGGMVFFPYQLAFGISCRWFGGLGYRIYLGPFKIWGQSLAP